MSWTRTPRTHAVTTPYEHNPDPKASQPLRGRAGLLDPKRIHRPRPLDISPSGDRQRHWMATSGRHVWISVDGHGPVWAIERASGPPVVAQLVRYGAPSVDKCSSALHVKTAPDSRFRRSGAVLCSWAVLGSNQRPLPCQGSALPLRQPPVRGGYSRWRRDLNPCRRLCRPLPRLSATPPSGIQAFAESPRGLRRRREAFERTTGLEPATSTLARLRSTN